MRCDRRQILHSLGATLLASSLMSASRAAAPSIMAPRAGFLLPLTGPDAALGRNMEQAISLIQRPTGSHDPFLILDAGPDAESAAMAAEKAIAGGAVILFGPLHADQIERVSMTASGRCPVLAFSNDRAAQRAGVYLLGITPSQCTSAVLRYARRRGVRRVGMIASDNAWDRAALIAAEAAQAELGITLTVIRLAPGQTDSQVIAALRAANMGEWPDAVLLPSIDAPRIGLARLLENTQILGTYQGLDATPGAHAALAGAWISAPDPEIFGAFAQSYNDRFKTSPGAIAAIARDAALIGQKLMAGGYQADRLFDPQGFEGATGRLRFQADGTVLRDLAILLIQDGQTAMIEHSSGA